MIESTLRFDDIEVIPGLLPLLQVVQRSHLRSRERSGRRPGNEANIYTHVYTTWAWFNMSTCTTMHIDKHKRI